jgi:hypothetical protein
MNRVFVPMVPSTFDSGTGLWIPKLNLDPAKRYGEIILCAPPNANRIPTGPMLDVMKSKLRDFRKDDYIVAVGDPSLIAAAVAIAVMKTGGMVNILKWDRLASDYLEIAIRV